MADRSVSQKAPGVDLASLYLQRMTQQAHTRNIHISHLRIILDDLSLYILNSTIKSITY